jgi:hypothetical protein
MRLGERRRPRRSCRRRRSRRKTLPSLLDLDLMAQAGTRGAAI